MTAHHRTLPVDARLKIARAEAIEAYSGMETSLAFLLARLLGTSPDLAGIVLFRITSTRARNKIIEQIIKRKYGSKFNLYWNSVLKFIGQLDQSRNEIVHWQMQLLPNFGRPPKRLLTSATARLVPPNIWDRRRGKAKHVEQTLTDFALKCEFAEAAVWFFSLYATGMKGGSRKMRATWRDIFQQPLAYPPLDTHPICLRWPKQILLLQPSRR